MSACEAAAAEEEGWSRENLPWRNIDAYLGRQLLSKSMRKTRSSRVVATCPSASSGRELKGIRWSAHELRNEITSQTTTKNIPSSQNVGCVLITHAASTICTIKISNCNNREKSRVMPTLGSLSVLTTGKYSLLLWWLVSTNYLVTVCLQTHQQWCSAGLCVCSFVPSSLAQSRASDTFAAFCLVVTRGLPLQQQHSRKSAVVFIQTSNTS